LLTGNQKPDSGEDLHPGQELGSVDEATFLLQGEAEKQIVLLLRGRSWWVVHIDWSKRDAWVEPIELPGRSLWLGGGVPLSFALCQAQKRVLLGEASYDRLTRRARQQIEELRGRFPWLEPDATTLEKVPGGRARWWTFGGLRANATLAGVAGEPGREGTEAPEGRPRAAPSPCRCGRHGGTG
jgi:ATP-dependent helicase Lhr and Lhr-like helicase